MHTETMQAAFDGYLPVKIKVGAVDYDLIVDYAADDYGQTSERHTHITIAGNQSVPSARDTLLHETLHAVTSVSGAGKLLELDDEAEERLIRLLSPWLLQLIRDNPSLIAFLASSSES